MDEEERSPKVLRPPSQWHTAIESVAIWTLGDMVAQSESQPRHVSRECGLRGVAKPAIRAQNGTPRAAHEKICADLAQTVGVPVPPVILWTDPTSGNKYSISAWAYKQAMTWNDLQHTVTNEFKENVKSQIAAGIVFHSFVGDTDRHGGNTLINVDRPSSSPEVCFIDHAFSLGHNQEFVNRNFTKVAHPYFPNQLISHEELVHAAEKVEALPKSRVEEIVRRIPEPFLSTPRADIIIDRLCERQSAIRRVLET